MGPSLLSPHPGGPGVSAAVERASSCQWCVLPSMSPAPHALLPVPGCPVQPVVEALLHPGGPDVGHTCLRECAAAALAAARNQACGWEEACLGGVYLSQVGVADGAEGGWHGPAGQEHSGRRTEVVTCLWCRPAVLMGVFSWVAWAYQECICSGGSAAHTWFLLLPGTTYAAWLLLAVAGTAAGRGSQRR